MITDGADWGLLQTPSMANAALGAYQAGMAIGQQRRVDAALSGVDLSRPETITPVLQASPQTGMALLGASQRLQAIQQAKDTQAAESQFVLAALKNQGQQPAPSYVPPDMGNVTLSPTGATAGGGDLSTGAGSPSLLHNITMQAESGGNPNAVSPKGAMGLMQTMPSTLTNPGFGVTPAQNNSPAELQRVGNDYFDAMMQRYGGNPAMAWAAYNAGPGNMDAALAKGGAGNFMSYLPAETRAYVTSNMAKLTHAGGLGMPSAAPNAAPAQAAPQTPNPVPGTAPVQQNAQVPDDTDMENARNALIQANPEQYFKVQQALSKLPNDKLTALNDAQTTFQQTAQSLKSVPYEQRAAALQHLAPFLAMHHIQPAQIAGFDPNDANLDMITTQAIGVKGAIDEEAKNRAAAAAESDKAATRAIEQARLGEDIRYHNVEAGLGAQRVAIAQQRANQGGMQGGAGASATAVVNGQRYAKVNGQWVQQ